MAGGQRGRLFRHPLPRGRRLARAGTGRLTWRGGPQTLPLPPRAGPVVDADGHVVEPLAAWADLPEAHRPVITADAHGYEHVTVGGTEILAVPLGTLARPGLDLRRPRGLPPAGRRPARRHPTRRPGWPTWTPRASTRPCSSRPSGCTSPSSRTPRRPSGWPSPTTTGSPATAPPTRPASSAPPCCRCRTRRPRPTSCGGRSRSSASWPASSVPTPASAARCPTAPTTPLWDVAEELDVPIGVHEGSSVIVPTLGSDRPFNPLILHAVSHSFEPMLACAQLIAFGMLERHPGLRVVFLESSGGWAPFWLERLDEQAESFGGFCPDLALRPVGVLRPPVRHQLRGRRAHAARAGALRRRRAASCGAATTRTTTPRSPARSTPSGPPSPRVPPRSRPRCSGSTPGGIYRLPSRRAGSGGDHRRLLRGRHRADVDMLRAAVRARRRRSTSTATAAAGATTSSPTTPSTRSCTRTSGPPPGLCRWTGTTVTVDIDVHLGGADRSRCATSSRPTASTSRRCWCAGFADVLRAAAPR